MGDKYIFFLSSFLADSSMGVSLATLTAMYIKMRKIWDLTFLWANHLHTQNPKAGDKVVPNFKMYIYFYFKWVILE